MRLILFECDSENRKCASRTEIDDFFSENIIELAIKKKTVTLNEYEGSEPISTAYISMYYSVRHVIDFVTANEFFIKQSKIELDDDSFGLFDDPVNYLTTEIDGGPYTIYKPSNKDPMSNKQA